MPLHPAIPSRSETAARQADVHCAVEELRHAQSRLEKVCEQLLTRLNPVLNSGPDGKPGIGSMPDAPNPYATPLTNGLREIGGGINRSINCLEDALSRLEL